MRKIGQSRLVSSRYVRVWQSMVGGGDLVKYSTIGWVN